MTISLIAAVDTNQLIGNGNQLPWHIPEDLAYFKKVTSGHPVVMGRKTYESIGSPLPNRKNIIMTRQHDFSAPGCSIIHSPDELSTIIDPSLEEIFIIGGAEIYHKFLPQADKLYITQIDSKFSGDGYFPEINWDSWQLMHEEPLAVEPFSVVAKIYKRNRS